MRMKTQVSSSLVPTPPVKSLPQAIKDGDMLYICGQLAFDPDAPGLIPDNLTISEQTDIVLKKVKHILSAAGAGLEHVLKTTIYVTDASSVLEMNEVYSQYFSTENPPARSTIGVAFLALPKARVEIEAIARLSQ
jgi:2-iminobutanoate/2-iminopropanoate deaminase